MPYFNSEGQDARVLPCGLVWVFSVRRHLKQYLLILKADNEDLIWASVGRKLNKGHFCALRTFHYVEHKA